MIKQLKIDKIYFIQQIALLLLVQTVVGFEQVLLVVLEAFGLHLIMIARQIQPGVLLFAAVCITHFLYWTFFIIG